MTKNKDKKALKTAKDLNAKSLNAFKAVLGKIINSKHEAYRQTNKVMVNLYWEIGHFISKKAENEGWGKTVVEGLALFIADEIGEKNGFSARNLWRMKQFYETYKDDEKLSAVLTEISWTNHLHILAKTKSKEERQFYLELATSNYYPERKFARIIDTGTYERTILANKKLSAVLTEFPANYSSLEGAFKDTYIFEFLNLAKEYNENDLRKELIKKFRDFLLEIGPDFTLIQDEFVVQVGMRDYKIDILLHHRGLNALVAVELKICEFKPEYLGKLQFYLEALDRDVKKPHENPSIGLLICKTKDEEVVRYALSRNVSPTIIAEYETKIIKKQILHKKLKELTEDMGFYEKV